MFPHKDDLQFNELKTENINGKRGLNSTDGPYTIVVQKCTTACETLDANWTNSYNQNLHLRDCHVSQTVNLPGGIPPQDPEYNWHDYDPISNPCNFDVGLEYFNNSGTI